MLQCSHHVMILALPGTGRVIHLCIPLGLLAHAELIGTLILDIAVFPFCSATCVDWRGLEPPTSALNGGLCPLSYQPLGGGP